MTLAVRPLWQRFLVFLLPLMLANILQSLSGTINNIYVGQLIGVDALASVSVFFPIIIFLISFVIGISAGATVLIGQAWGAGNVDRVKQVMGTTLTLAFLGGLCVAVASLFFTPAVIQLLGTPHDIVDDAVRYARIMLLGMPAMFVFIISTSVLRGVGDTLTPLVALTLSITVGALLTPALIQGWLGLPRIGVRAAAVATITGFLTILTFLFFYMRARRHPLAPDIILLRYLRLDRGILRMVMRIGIPSAVQTVVASVAAIVIVGLVNRFGSNATAAYGAVNQILNYVQFPALSIGIAASIFAAQAIGAGHGDMLGAITRTALLTNLFLTGGLILIAYIFSQDIIELFITDPAVVELAQRLLHIILWSLILFGASATLAGIMRASGTVLLPMIFALIGIVLVELPVAIALSRGPLGLDGIWWGYVASFAAVLLMNIVYYLRIWKKKPIRKLI